MPIYAFECAECGHSFDRLQKLSDPDPAACPECDAAAIRRQLTAPSFRLSGSGWYETDFKKDGDRKRNLAGDSSETGKAAEPAKADKPAEPKPAAKAEPATKSAEGAKPSSKPAAPAAKPAS